MNCSVCNDLHRAFQRTHCCYVDACSAAFYRVSTEIAAMKHVAMERAKSDLYEHQLDCPLARSAERSTTGPGTTITSASQRHSASDRPLDRAATT
jgi:hypothetical protein